MKTTLSSRRHQYLVRVSVFLIAAVLIAGIVGCGDGNGYNPPVQNLEIHTWYDLDAVRDNWSGNHTLMNDLDSTTAGYGELASVPANNGRGWQPIGSIEGPPFTGTFNGQGYEIRDLFINRPNEDAVGLFSLVTTGGVIKNLGVVNATVAGHEYVGSLVGFHNGGTVIDCYATGIVTGDSDFGGLVGWSAAVIYDSHFAGRTSCVGFGHNIGGLVGRNSGAVNKCYSTGSVIGGVCVGGLVGWNVGTVLDCYSSSQSTSYDGHQVGGLVGLNYGTVSDSYAAGNVTGTDYVGGLIGFNFKNNYSDSVIKNSYATGCVIAEFNAGGLVAGNNGTVIDCYATGNVTGEVTGGLVGWNAGIVSNSFWDTETSGQATSDGGTGKTTAQMQDIATFSGAAWSIVAVANPSTRNLAYIWNIVDDETYPFLSWQPVS